MLTHGNFMFELAVAVEELDELFAPRDGAPSTLLFLPLAHVFARIIQVGACKRPRADGPLRRHQAPARRPRGVPADVHPRRPPRLREGLQHRVSQRAVGRRPRHGSSTGPPTSAIAWSAGRWRPGRPGPAVRGPARASSTGSSTRRLRDGARRPVRVRRLRRRPLGERLGHFYRGHRGHRARGLRAHRDDGRGHRQPARRAEDRHGRPAAAAAPRPGRRRRRAAVPRRPGLRRLLAQRRGDRRGLRTPTAGSAPATSARSTTRASSGSPAARRRSW